MNIIIRNEYRVEAELNSCELQTFGVTYEELDYKNIETRRFLWMLLDKVRERYGISFSLSGRILIEIMKENEDMYRICFSSLSSGKEDGASVKQLIRSENKPVVAQFDNVEDMLSVIAVLPSDINSSLYENAGKYRMIFMLPSQEKTALQCKICEFCEISGEPVTEKARCEEMWNCIIACDAVKKLISAFSVK